MEFLYPFFIAFAFVFVSELGDKTQLLVLSFSSKLKSYTILLGVALGSLFSHGIAIIFGSTLGGLDNVFVNNVLKFITYVSFIFFGVITLMSKEANEDSSKKTGVLKKISSLGIGYVFVIAFSIAIGELGDKTFLASLGLGIGYPNYKFYLICGAIFGMVISDYIAILLGKFLKTKISDKAMNVLSGVIFLVFGFLGLISFFTNLV